MGTGGSRSGAGRPAMHVKAEHCRRIDVRRWHREGILRSGSAGTWQWSDPDTGERRASIGHRSDGRVMTLDYAIDGLPQMQAIRISESSCTYGGKRPWFVCPIRGERVAVLFLRAGRFACRHCQRVAYGSQSGDVCDRTWRKQAKAEAKLGPNWQRPKGMHAKTRERLLSTIFECEERRDIALSDHLADLMCRYPSLRSDPMFR
jgi:hypothetical protein